MNMSNMIVRALHMRQGGHDLYLFAVPGDRLLDIAEISRIGRDAAGMLEGYQRGEIRSHVADIARYLSDGDVLFPNPILLALSPDVRFKSARGSRPPGMLQTGDVGTLSLPTGINKPGWIVDGQQRVLALAKADAKAMVVPVVAFVSTDIAVHREQFVLVNKARPLPRAIVDALLPTMDAAVLPRDLGPRKIPSVLVDTLNSHRDSPLYGLIRRPGGVETAIIGDQALLRSIKRSISSPLGALSPYGHGGGEPDVQAMYDLLSGFWSAVREAFPDAWGHPPSESRLMHAAGIEVMGYLMDRILSRPDAARTPREATAAALERIAPHCRWTSGKWDGLEIEWNAVECTARSIARLRDHLIRLEHQPRLVA